MRRVSRRGSPQGAAFLRLSSWALALALVLAALFVTENARAYPWMIRHGYTNCAGCHADPSGGELLTLYGHAISYEVLSTRWGGPPQTASLRESDEAVKRRIARAASKAAHAKNATEEEADDATADEDAADADDTQDADAAAEESAEVAAPAEEPSPFEGMSPITGPLFGLLPPTESLLLGGSVRLASTYKLSDSEASTDDSKVRFFPMQLDLYGQYRLGPFRFSASAGALKVPAGSPHGRPAQVTGNQGDGYNLISRTHWVGYDFGDGAHLVRLGRLNLPFGIRMSEHTMWVRDRTRTDRESDQQHGVSLYLGFDTFRLELMAILGNYQISPDRFRERGYSGYMEFVASSQLVLGLSSLFTHAKDDALEPSGLSTTRQAHGPFVRWSPAEKVAVMAEMDVLLRSRRETGYVGYLQVDVEPLQGLHAIATGELLDAGYSDLQKRNGEPRSSGLGRTAAGGWLSLQWFFLPHFDLRLDAILRQDKQLLAQLHIYL